MLKSLKLYRYRGSWAGCNRHGNTHGNSATDRSERTNTPNPPSYAAITSRPRAHRSSVSSVLSYSSAPNPDLLRYQDKQTSCEKEHFHLYNTLPDRPCSAFIHLDKDVSTANVFADVRNAGIPHSSVRFIQRNSTGSAFITFASEEHCNLYLQKSSYIPHNNHADDSDCFCCCI